MKRTLYFVTRNDLHPGRRAAQLIHAMDEWAARHGPHQGTVIVYAVRDLRRGTFALSRFRGCRALWGVFSAVPFGRLQ